jgi:hypothetical protein
MLVVEARRADDVRPNGRHEGLEPRTRSRVQSVAEAASLGPPQAEEKSAMTVWICVDARPRLSPLVTGLDAVQNDCRAGAEGERNHDSKS